MSSATRIEPLVPRTKITLEMTEEEATGLMRILGRYIYDDGYADDFRAIEIRSSLYIAGIRDKEIICTWEE